jgi:hypothetical protein
VERELRGVCLQKEADMTTRSHGHQEAVVESGSKTDSTFELTDGQWEIIEDLFPWAPPGDEGGRPTVKPRECLEGGMKYWTLFALRMMTGNVTYKLPHKSMGLNLEAIASKLF